MAPAIANIFENDIFKKWLFKRQWRHGLSLILKEGPRKERKVTSINEAWSNERKIELNGRVMNSTRSDLETCWHCLLSNEELHQLFNMSGDKGSQDQKQTNVTAWLSGASAGLLSTKRNDAKISKSRGHLSTSCGGRSRPPRRMNSMLLKHRRNQTIHVRLDRFPSVIDR